MVHSYHGILWAQLLKTMKQQMYWHGRMSIIEHWKKEGGRSLSLHGMILFYSKEIKTIQICVTHKIHWKEYLPNPQELLLWDWDCVRCRNFDFFTLHISEWFELLVIKSFIILKWLMYLKVTQCFWKAYPIFFFMSYFVR